MKIALDATPLSANIGGIRRYADELSRALAREYPADEFWLESDQRFDCIAAGLPNLHCGRAPVNVLERRWWTVGLPRELARIGADVFHGTDFGVPYRGATPAVMTVHDLSPWREETSDEVSARVRRRAAALLRLDKPRLVITPTAVVRGGLIEAFRLEPDRVVVTPLAASETFQRVDGPHPERPYFLHVGAIQKRKNLGVIVEAWRALRESQDVDLILAGRVPRKGAEALTSEPGLRIVQNEDDAALSRLYSGAVACLMPSRYEGFGFPVLEAMQCGCPVVASRDPALREVSGGAAEHVDATDGP